MSIDPQERPRPASAEAAPGITGRALFLMSLSVALAVSTIYYNQPLLPQMAASFGAEAVQHASLIATLTQLGYAAGLLTFIPLGDRIQPRKLATVAVSLNAIALLACAAAPNFALLLLATFLVGLTAVTAQIIIPAVSGRAPAETRGHILGSLLGGLSAGVLLARTVSGFVGAHLGWHAVFLLAAAADVVLLAVVTRNLPVSTTLATIRYADLMRSLAHLLREERMLRIASAAAAMLFAAFSALWASLAFLLSRPPYAFGPAAIGAFGLVGLVGIASSSRVGLLVDRIGPRRMVFAGAVASAVAFACVAASSHSLAWLVIGMVLLDFGNRAVLVASQARIQALRPEARSRLNTVLMTSYFVGGAAGAALGGYGAHRAGWSGLAVAGALFALAAFALNAVGSRTARTTPSDQSGTQATGRSLIQTGPEGYKVQPPAPVGSNARPGSSPPILHLQGMHMSNKIAVVYFSGYGHTHKIAEAVASGANARLLRIDDLGNLPAGGWQHLADADAIIFGSPTYIGNVSWQFKKFIDESSKVWAESGWKDKLAAGFTNSAGMNGDKFSTLSVLFTMAQQHGMLWVGTGMMPSNAKSSKRDDLNYVASFAGLAATTPSDASADEVVQGDLETARLFGARVSAQVARLAATETATA